MSRHYRSGSQQQDKNKHKHIFTCLFNCHGRIASKLNATELNPIQSNIIHFRLGFFNLIESHDLSLIWALLCLTHYASCICLAVGCHFYNDDSYQLIHQIIHYSIIKYVKNTLEIKE